MDELTAATTTSRREWRGDASLFSFVLFSQSLYRLALISAFAGDAAVRDILLAMAIGARFDSVIATVVITPSLILALVLRQHMAAARVRRWCASLYVFVATMFAVVDFAFFAELKGHLDQRVYLLRSVGAATIARTIWSSQHPVLEMLVALVVMCCGVAFVQRVWRHPPSAGRSKAVALAWLVFYVPALRGLSIARSPIRVRNAFVTTHATLNHTIPSPVATLWHALEDHADAIRPVSDGEVAKALAAFGLEPKAPRELVPALLRSTGGDQATQAPRHIVIILLEGQHGFALLPRFRRDGMESELGRLADEGAYFPRSVSAGQQTDNTLAVVVGGLFIPGVNLLHDERAQTVWPTAIAPQFARLGYRTRFFYGGSLGWSRLEDFVRGQGFDEVYGAPHIAGEGNEWGSWDEHLFAYAEQRIADEVPSLDVILTTTNHSPFDLDEKRLRTFTDLPSRFALEDERTRRVLAHERYVDAQVSAFARRVDRRVRGALFAITADHVAGAATLDALSPFERVAIPLVFFGTALPPSKRGVVASSGSQLDLFPTLFALSAPRGAPYVALGDDLFAPRAPRCAVGVGVQLCGDVLLDMESDQLSEVNLPEYPRVDTPRPTRDRFTAAALLSRALLWGVSPR